MIAIGQKTNSPPEVSSAIEAYIVGEAATGDWSGYAENDLVVSQGSGWLKRTPIAGERFYSSDEGMDIFFDGTDWYGIISPFNLEFQASHATAANTVRKGRITSTTTLLNAIFPSGKSLIILSAEMCWKSGATVGTYGLYPILYDQGGATSHRLGSMLTCSENVQNRTLVTGTLASPLALVDGDGTKQFSCGWEHDVSSPGALASGYHGCYIRGYILEKL